MRRLTIRQNPDLVRPKPGGQGPFLDEWKHHFVGLEGGWGAGKTFCGAHKLLAAHVVNAFDLRTYRKLCVPSAVVGPTFRSLMDFDLPALEKAAAAMGLRFRYRAGDKTLFFPTLSTPAEESLVLLRSADDPDRITGWEVGYAWGDEPTRWPEDRLDPRKDAFLQLTGRVRHPLANVRGICLTYTNEGDGTRMYEWFHSGKIDSVLYRARTADNDAVRDFYDLQKQRMSPELAEQYLEGGYMNLRGARCYPQFDSQAHVSENATLAAGVPLALTLDFNISPGMHALLGQYLPAQDLFVVASEFHRARLSVRDLVPLAVAEIRNFGARTIDIYGDSSGHAGSPQTGESAYDVLLKGLAEAGIEWQLHVPRDVVMPIDHVNAANMALKDLQGQQHVLIHPSCHKLIEDLRLVKFDEKGKVDKKNPLLTHSSDAFGYWAHYVRPVRVELERAPDRYSVSVR